MQTLESFDQLDIILDLPFISDYLEVLFEDFNNICQVNFL